ncbi:MAG TPA: alpha/beta fold hydrolase [Micromonosporaceae bacterium]|nr:alpha/beta fold hydrolase [Micromonosporaceae bacterium]
MAAVVLLAACGEGSTKNPSTATSSAVTEPIAACVSAEEQRAGGLHLPAANGHFIDGVLLGTGTTGVVLANQSNGDLCQWKSSYADHLTQAGFRVAVFNYSSQPADKDVAAVAEALRKAGATKVFLVGASMGGTASLAAGAHAEPAVAGVISISAPRDYGATNALGAVPTLKAPALFIAAEHDQPFARDAQALHDACGSTEKQISIEPGGNHGVALLSDRVSALVDGFLKDH